MLGRFVCPLSVMAAVNGHKLNVVIKMHTVSRRCPAAARLNERPNVRVASGRRRQRFVRRSPVNGQHLSRPYYERHFVHRRVNAMQKNAKQTSMARKKSSNSGKKQ